MIIWLNGAFGVGKTTVASLLDARDPSLRSFDPEHLGAMLRSNLADHTVTDFQDHALWRRLVPAVADELIMFTRQSLVVPQTVLDEAYWAEIERGIVERGHDLLHVLLDVDDVQLGCRIDTDDVERSARHWRRAHVPRYAAARAWLARRADLVVDTTHLTPREVTERVRSAIATQVRPSRDVRP